MIYIYIYIYIHYSTIHVLSCSFFLLPFSFCFCFVLGRLQEWIEECIRVFHQPEAQQRRLADSEVCGPTAAGGEGHYGAGSGNEAGSGR